MKRKAATSVSASGRSRDGEQAESGGISSWTRLSAVQDAALVELVIDCRRTEPRAPRRGCSAQAGL